MFLYGSLSCTCDFYRDSYFHNFERFTLSSSHKLTNNRVPTSYIERRIYVFNVDVQAVQVILFLKSSPTHFKKQLHAHRFTTLNLRSKDAICCVWHEGLHFLDQELTVADTTKPIIFYSDGCCAKNCNSTLSSALYY